MELKHEQLQKYGGGGKNTVVGIFYNLKRYGQRTKLNGKKLVLTQFI